jgi:hypothetical protein
VTSLTLGSYRLIAELGHGGMADVYLAAVEGPAGSGFTKLAVLKKLRSHLAEDPEFVSMLMDEGRITARLSHPNVVQLFEVGHVDDQYFLAMEYLDGQPLHRVMQRIERRGRNGDAVVERDVYYAIVSDVLAGLHNAHELADYDGTPLEVVHRDVTPHNIFVTYDGTVKVVDFGIAKAVGRLTVTKHGTVKGKIRYMSPEQITGGHIDRRTDIFAAGVILWNSATGLKLWADRDDVDVALALHDGNYPASPREFSPEVPQEIDAICRKALAFRREDRYGTAKEMRADLEAFLGRRGVAARKKLATTMKELFVKDRAKSRAVLDASGLKSVASIEALTAAIGVVPRAQAKARRGAPVAPVAPVAAPTAAGGRARPPRDIDRADRAQRRTTAPRRSAHVLHALAIGAALGACVVVFRYRATTAPSFAARPHVPAIVASDLTTSSDGTRSKLEPSQAPVKSSFVAPTAVHVADGMATSSASPSASATTSADAEKRTRKRALDGSDPWGSAAPAGAR